MLNLQIYLLPADRVKLNQIMYNLLSNAIKFSYQNSNIWLKAEKCQLMNGDAVRFSVKDQGIGIKEEDFERVFIEFEQVDNSLSREYDGTGLGLPLFKRQVELHGGIIEFSSHPDLGTEVVFILPIVEELLPDNYKVIKNDREEK